MAGLIGLLSGAAVGALAGHHREQQQQKQQQSTMWQNFVLQSAQQHPEIAATPEFQKEAKKLFGDHAELAITMFGQQAQAKQKAEQEFQKMNAGGGGGPQSPTDLKGWETLRDKYTAAMDDPALQDPAHQALLKRHIDQADKAISEARLEQTHQDTLANQALNRQETEANRQVMQQIAASNAESNAQFKKFQEQLDQEKETDAKQKAFDSAKGELQKQLNNLNKAVTTMDATQVKPLLDAYNKASASLAKRAKAQGVDYDPGEFEPLTAETVPNHPWLGGMSGKTTTLGPPEYIVTDDKGNKQKWDGKAWQPVK
jgi:hypothetical protein